MGLRVRVAGRAHLGQEEEHTRGAAHVPGLGEGEGWVKVRVRVRVRLRVRVRVRDRVPARVRVRARTSRARRSRPGHQRRGRPWLSVAADTAAA